MCCRCNCIVIDTAVAMLQDVNPWVSVTHQGNIAYNGLHIECEVRDPEGVECEERANWPRWHVQALLPHIL